MGYTTMERPTITTQTIRFIANSTLKAIRQLQKGLLAGTLSAEQLDAIDSLPSGALEKRSPVDGHITGFADSTGRTRIAEFPEIFCADAVATLGILYTMAGVKPDDVVEVKAVPRKPNPPFNFHKWLCVQGISIDLTLGQFHPLGDSIGDMVLFETHPFENDIQYTITEAPFIPPTQIVKFAEHIGFTYIFKL